MEDEWFKLRNVDLGFFVGIVGLSTEGTEWCEEVEMKQKEKKSQELLIPYYFKNLPK